MNFNLSSVLFIITSAIFIQIIINLFLLSYNSSNNTAVIHNIDDIPPGHLSCTSFYTNKTVIVSEEYLYNQRKKGIQHFDLYDCYPKKKIPYDITKWKENDTIVFHHFQKAGGTSFMFRLYYNCCFKNQQFCHYLQIKSDTPFEDCGLNSAGKDFHFHSPVSIIQDLFSPIDSKFLVLFRDPNYRIRSEYNHLSQKYNYSNSSRECWLHHQPICKTLSNNEMTFEEFLEYPGNPAINRQSEHFLLSIFDNSNSVNLAELRNNWFRYFSIKESEITNHLNTNKHQYLKLILDIIDTYYIWYGTVEKFCESFVIFNYIFHDANVNAIETEKPKKPISEELYEEISQNNELDRLLYNTINQMIMERYNYIISLDESLDIC